MMIMGKYLAIAPAMAALLLAAACSNDDSVEGTDENFGGTDELVELRLTSSIEAQTRATHDLDTQIATGETVHVWVDDAGLTEEAELYEDNAMTVADGGSLTDGETMYFPSTGNTVNIYAIHGNFGSDELSSFWDTAVTHSVEQDQQSTVTEAGEGYAVSDLVYCERDAVGRTTSAVELTFKHLLSKVEVVLKQGDGEPVIASAAILNTQLDAVFTPSKDSDITVTASGSTGEIAIDADVSDDNNTYLNEGIIVPQTLSEGTAFIRITTDEGGVLVYSLADATTFEAGKKYRFTITVSLTGLDVTTSVEDWTDEGNTDGEAEWVDYTISTDNNGRRTYTVYTEAGLNAWSEYTRDGNRSTNCTLGANITLTSSWTSVGTSSSNSYTGTFDGDGYTISGLTISATSDFQGFIGRLDSDGVVKNLTLAYVNISATDYYYIGAVVGSNHGTITDCSVSGSVIGYSFTGGVTGWSISTITDCCFTGTVSGTYNIGGVAGCNYGTVTNCYSTATAEGYMYVSGVVGDNDEGGIVTACYSTGKASGTYYVGGVVGDNYEGGIVTACYSTGSVSGNDAVGGVAGYNDEGTVTACYATGTVSGSRQTGGVVGRNYYGTVSTCYWYSSASDSDATYVDGTEVTWTIAASAMNTALSDGGYNWQYELNTDSETSGNEPLKLVSTATE